MMRRALVRCRSYFGASPPALPLEERYSKAVSALHWTVGLAVVGVVATVKIAQNTDKSDTEKRGRLMHVHKSLALVVAALVPVRVAVRLASRIPNHLPGLATWQNRAGTASHVALYGLLVGMPVSGIVMGWYGGYGMPFFWTKFQGAATPNKQIAGAAYQAHSLMGQALFYLIPVHVGASLLHAYRGQKIFQRINPFI